MARKVLLADDSVTAQNMGRKILADAGYEVTTVNNGSAALKKIAELKPDLVVLDIYMPGYSGLEVCQRLKESPDTAHLPVLLTVGKLEPFKPEEAQRVRADAFIVKPFEASELLGTLSKLEDKVVPRSEGAKAGRFARAVSRIDSNSGKDESETTWRDRIKFPSQKKEVAEQSPDDGALYNPMNRDLRTVVDRPANPTAVLPVDATQEELAALAAAASKLNASVSAPTSKPVAESAPAPVEIAQSSRSVFDIDPVPAQAVQPVSAVDAVTETAQASSVEPEKTEAAQEPSEQDVQAAIASLSSIERDTNPSNDAPMTMAAATQEAPHFGEPRWAAVAVALSPEEAELSLEREMEKAYSARVPAESPDHAGEPAMTSNSMSEPFPQESPTISDSVSAVASAAVSNPRAAEPIASATPETHAQSSQVETEQAKEKLPAHTGETSAAAEQAVEAPAPVSERTEVAAEVASDVAPSSLNVTSESAIPHQAEAALAVAAGAERLMEDAKAAAPGADPNSIASIVESVMAELRPKLVEEITRKLAAERK